MELDFTGLNNIGGSKTRKKNKEGLKKAPGRPVAETLGQNSTKVPDKSKGLVKTGDGPTELQEAIGGRTLINLNREQRSIEAQQEIYKVYQNNKKHSEHLNAEILKGIREGAKPELLLLQAVECISCMTGDRVYYEQVKQELKVVYGEALFQEIPLKLQLEEAQERLEKLKKALQRGMEDSSAQRVKRAIKAHEKQIGRLKALIQKAGK